MVQRKVNIQPEATEIEAEISELEKHRERLVTELFQLASKEDYSRRAMVEQVAHNPEIGRIDARIEALQARQAALRIES